MAPGVRRHRPRAAAAAAAPLVLRARLFIQCNSGADSPGGSAPPPPPPQQYLPSHFDEVAANLLAGKSFTCTQCGKCCTMEDQGEVRRCLFLFAGVDAVCSARAAGASLRPLLCP